MNNKPSVYLMTLGAAVVGTAALPPTAALAACLGASPTSADDGSSAYDNVPAYGDNIRAGSLPSIQSGLNRIQAQATTTNDVVLSTASVNATDTGCLAEAFAAPIVAQGLNQARAHLAQVQARLAQLHALNRGQTGGPKLSIYAVGDDQSRREGGNTRTGTQALRVSRTDVTVGADYRLNDQWAAGAAVGFGAPRLRWAGNTVRVDGRSANITAYGTFSPTASTYLAAAASTEGTRYTVHTNDNGLETFNDTNGISHGLSLSAGYDLQLGGWALSPYARVDEVSSRVGSFGNVSYSNKGRSGSVSAGTQVQTSVPMSWGLIAPHARVEFTQITGWRLQGDSAALYAANNSALATPNPLQLDRQFGQFGVGAAAVLPGGLTLFSDYDTGFGQKNVSSWRFTLGVRTEL